MLRNLLPFGVGMALVVGSTCVHGVLTNRWGLPADLPAAAAKLEKVPHVIGDWHSRPVEVPEGQLQAAETVGHFARAYRNERTRTEIQVLVVCGEHGPIACHPPTICFTGAGYEQTKTETKATVSQKEFRGEFWNTIFTKKTAEGIEIPLRTYWAWTIDGKCEAPENPRFHFAGRPSLYKIYITQVLRPAQSQRGEQEEEAEFEAFLNAFLPEFQAALSEKSPS